MSTPADLLQWSAWRPLATASVDREISSLPGLYRIRRIDRDDLDYIGQTSLPLRKRLAMLSGVFKEEMPYAAPHTAGPALWALRHATNCEFECSVVPVDGDTPWRKGMEAVAIALYRQEFGQSPTIEFGRIMVGYRPSSGNSSKLTAAGKQFRGGPSDEPHFRHAPGVAPAGPLHGDPQGESWGGHVWSAWIPLGQSIGANAVAGSGLYRIRGDDDRSLLYVGQGLVPDRPLAHFGKTRRADHRQGPIFRAHSRLEWSAVMNDAWLPHQRLELENDLIAAHMLTTGEIPAAQFLDGTTSAAS